MTVIRKNEENRPMNAGIPQFRSDLHEPDFVCSMIRVVSNGIFDRFYEPTQIMKALSIALKWQANRDTLAS